MKSRGTATSLADLPVDLLQYINTHSFPVFRVLNTTAPHIRGRIMFMTQMTTDDQIFSVEFIFIQCHVKRQELEELFKKHVKYIDSVTSEYKHVNEILTGEYQVDFGFKLKQMSHGSHEQLVEQWLELKSGVTIAINEYLETQFAPTYTCNDTNVSVPAIVHFDDFPQFMPKYFALERKRFEADLFIGFYDNKIPSLEAVNRLFPKPPLGLKPLRPGEQHRPDLRFGYERDWPRNELQRERLRAHAQA